MSAAFEKAKEVIEAFHGRYGCYPEEVALVRYDAASFMALRPGEDFKAHQRQRAAVIAWCSRHKIAVIDHDVTVLAEG